MESKKKPIWHMPVTADDLNNLHRAHIVKYLGIQFVEVGDNFMKASMPVDERTTQPYGLMHGGIAVVLAETLGSTAGACVVDVAKYGVVGVEVNANHLKSVRSGIVTAVASPLHLGAKTQVWEMKIYNANEELVTASRLTLAVIEMKGFRKK